MRFRVTDIVVRCPHCGRCFRLAVALLDKKRREKIKTEVEDDVP